MNPGSVGNIIDPCGKLFSHVRSFLVTWDEFYLCGLTSTGICTGPPWKPVVMCYHVIIKKASEKLFCHAGGPEKQWILFAWPNSIDGCCSYTISLLELISVWTDFRPILKVFVYTVPWKVDNFHPWMILKVLNHSLPYTTPFTVY